MTGATELRSDFDALWRDGVKRLGYGSDRVG